MSAVIAQIFNPVIELAIPTRSPTNEPNAETKTHQVAAETKRKFFMQFKVQHTFLLFSAINI